MKVRRYNRFALAQLGVLFADDGDGGGGGADTAAADAAAADAAAKTAADEAAAKATAGEKVEDLPEWAQKVIRDTRKEAGDARANAKSAAADDARAEMAQTIGKALGLVKGDAAPTAEQLATEIASAKTGERTALVELAVFKAAGPAGANPVSLLDSRSFLAKVADLDPAKGDFDKKVAAAITEAVKDHPELKAALAAARNGVDHSGGTGEGVKRVPKSLDQAVAGHYGT